MFLMFLPVLFPLFAVLASCPSSVITTSTPFSRIERSPGVYTPSFQVPRNPAWVLLPGAQYIWESAASTSGIFKFVASFSMPKWTTQTISSLHLLIACDNQFAVTFNGVVVAPKWTGGYTRIYSYELKPLLKGSDATLGFQDNQLEIFANNWGGPGGLVYKLEITYCKQLSARACTR